MKKLLFLISLLFLLSPTAYADYELGEYVCEMPETLYTPPAVSFFTEPTVEETLYNRFESAVVNAATDGALQSSVYIPISDIGVDFAADDATVDYLLNIYSNVVYNNPQIGNLISGISARAENGKITKIRPLYRAIYNEQTYQSLATDEEKADYLAKTHNVDAFNQAVKYAYSKAIAPDMTADWQKLLSIHDYLADTITYSDIVASGTDAQIDAYKENTNYLAWTTYSALVGDRISVCQGYSLAFKLLCDMAGIECGYAVSAKHIWNIAECNGNYYHIDVTWDDTITVVVTDENENNYRCTSDHVLRRHFLRSDTDSSTLHSTEGVWTTNMPKCTDSVYRNTLLAGELDTIYSRLWWDNNTFWFEAYDHYLNPDAETVTCYPSERYYKFTENGFVRSSYEKLEAVMYNVFPLSSTINLIAIDGTADTNADFYAAKYTEDGVLIDVYKTDITFNSYGEAVAEFPNVCNRLFLFTDKGIKPLAHSK
ncbi:MAG: hypothetical protein UIM24_03355 [Clostridia bacterium]|nr:hypothetical protein [Clostridia bacterium]